MGTAIRNRQSKRSTGAPIQTRTLDLRVGVPTGDPTSPLRASPKASNKACSDFVVLKPNVGDGTAPMCGDPTANVVDL